MSAVLHRPVICVVTRARGAPSSPERTALLDRLEAAARAGASMIQVRERQLDDRHLLAFVAQLIEVTRPHGAKLLVNERTDIALAGGADGVHLKSDAPSVADVRRIVPPGFIVGRSVHSVEEARTAAVVGGCDYVLFGTVFPSASKPDGHAVAGVEELAAVCHAVSLPVVAIGGVTVGRAPEIAAAGAAGIAAISLFAVTNDISGVVGSLRDALTPPLPSV